VLLTVLVQFSCFSSDDKDNSGGDSARFTKGYAEYQYANTGSLGTISHRIKIVLCGPDITLNGVTASGRDNVLIIWFNSESSTSITERSYYYGDYNSLYSGVITTAEIYEAMDASSISAGIQNFVYDRKGWLCKGFVGVTRSGNSYTFDVDLSDLYDDYKLETEITIENLIFY